MKPIRWTELKPSDTFKDGDSFKAKDLPDTPFSYVTQNVQGLFGNNVGRMMLSNPAYLFYRPHKTDYDNEEEL